MRCSLLVRYNPEGLAIAWNSHQMLNRQVMKSENNHITTWIIEGILVRSADELQALQEERKKVDPQTAEAIDEFILKLRSCATGNSSFTFILDDPAGNSFIENPYAPSVNPSLTIDFYERTHDQQASLGYLVDQSQTREHENDDSSNKNNQTSQPHGSVGAVAGRRAIAQGNTAEFAETLLRYTAPEEVMTFPSTCGACAVRNSELKAGGAIPAKGKKVTLIVRNVNDLSRDVIKSDTASVKIPEIDLELAGGTLGGLVTTLEGLVTKINESLERVHGFTFGDSLDEDGRSKWLDFKARLLKLLNIEEPWTLILDDALANSFIPFVDEYERSWEQNEELGLNDMDTSSADVAYAS
ncbi:hypothetical protein Lser_V15G22222 [Lactuca serriola]